MKIENSIFDLHIYRFPPFSLIGWFLKKNKMNTTKTKTQEALEGVLTVAAVLIIAYIPIYALNKIISSERI